MDSFSHAGLLTHIFNSKFGKNRALVSDQYSVLADIQSFGALAVGLGAQSGTTAPEPVEMGRASDQDAFWRTPCVGIQLRGDLEADLEHTDLGMPQNTPEGSGGEARLDYCN